MDQSKKDLSKGDLFKEYIFFLKLTEQGLWSFRLEEEVKKTLKKGRISFGGDNHAFISVMAFSNMLTKTVPIHFKIKLRQQERQWKINVPSTFAYTEQQIEKAATNKSLKQKYRSNIIEEIEKMDKTIRVHPKWFF